MVADTINHLSFQRKKLLFVVLCLGIAECSSYALPVEQSSFHTVSSHFGEKLFTCLSSVSPQLVTIYYFFPNSYMEPGGQHQLASVC